MPEATILERPDPVAISELLYRWELRGYIVLELESVPDNLTLEPFDNA